MICAAVCKQEGTTKQYAIIGMKEIYDHKINIESVNCELLTNMEQNGCLIVYTFHVRFQHILMYDNTRSVHCYFNKYNIHDL